jgi:hypothetical protein
MRVVVLVGLLAVTALVRCGDDDAEKQLRAARERAQAAPYRIVRSPGRALFIARRTLVIRSGGRVVAWNDGHTDITWESPRACYRRTSDFNGADLMDVRREAAPPAAGDVHRTERGDRAILSYEIPGGVDSAGEEGEVVLDARGRARLVRRRSKRWGDIPPGRWTTIRFVYPDRRAFLALLPSKPRPDC